MKTYKKNEYGLVPVRSMVPRSYLAKLKELSTQTQTPMSLLVVRALRNEFMCENPFEAPVFHLPKLVPDSPETAATPQSRKLFDFIQKYPGLTLEQLFMCKDEIGLPNDDEFLRCYSMLLTVGVIVEEYPIRAKFAYSDDHRIVKVKLNKNLVRDVKRKFKKLDYEKSPLHEVANDEE